MLLNFLVYKVTGDELTREKALKTTCIVDILPCQLVALSPCQLQNLSLRKLNN